jgi:hypothetical protein
MSTEDHFAAPLGASKSGSLRFTNGAHRVAIRADSHGLGLYRARFGDRGANNVSFDRQPAAGDRG